MDRSSGSYIDPEVLAQLPNNYAHLLPFQPQPTPIEPTGGSIGRKTTTDGTSPCIDQDSTADSGYGTGPDIPRYLAMPIDLHHQQTSLIPEDRNAIQNHRCGNYSSKNNRDAIVKLEKETDRHILAHSRRSSRSSNRLTSDESGIDKRERNRMAASKCRKKQKIANNELQERARVMEQHHNYLAMHKASLELETLNLKNQLLLHGGCDYEPITEYLMQAAKKFVTGHKEDTQNVQRMEHQHDRLPSTGSETCAL